MNIKFYGVRGSYPVCHSDFSAYGGHTACVFFSKTVNNITHRLIVDAGTGIIDLGQKLIHDVAASKGPYHIHLLLTHYHLDHIIGLSHFAPIHHPNTVLHVYGMDLNHIEVEDVLKEHISNVTFPVSYTDMKSTRVHYTVFDKSVFEIGPFHVNVMKAGSEYHPCDGALYFRITDTETQKSAVCLWDHEAKEKNNDEIHNFIKDANVLIHDTHYTTADYFSTTYLVKGFGHSTYAMAIRAAKKANIKDKLVCFHLNPTHTDKMLDNVQHTRQEHCPIPLWIAKQGDSINV